MKTADYSQIKLADFGRFRLSRHFIFAWDNMSRCVFSDWRVQNKNVNFQFALYRHIEIAEFQWIFFIHSKNVIIFTANISNVLYLNKLKWAKKKRSAEFAEWRVKSVKIVPIWQNSSIELWAVDGPCHVYKFPFAPICIIIINIVIACVCIFLLLFWMCLHFVAACNVCYFEH